jgi:hypothetical protein
MLGDISLFHSITRLIREHVCRTRHLGQVDIINHFGSHITSLMGGDISGNYTSIAPIFVTGFWKVHSAVSKATGDPVSLWLLDEPSVSRQRSRAEREAFLASCVYSCQQLRKFHHPSILRVNEFSDSTRQVAFAAEPVASCLVHETALTIDETEYVADQLAHVLCFLHSGPKRCHLNVSPQSSVLTQNFALKLCGVNFWGRSVEWTNSPFLPPMHFSAPEFTIGKGATEACDVFSFGAVVVGCYLRRQLYSSTTQFEMARVVAGGLPVIPTQCSEAMLRLLRSCLLALPEARPAFAEIVKADAFDSAQLRAYRYLDTIVTRQPLEKFSFFKSLRQTLNAFSTRILRHKLLPILMADTLINGRFAPVTIPLIVEIGATFSIEEFSTEIFAPLSKFLRVTRPAEICLSVFNVMHIFVEKISRELHCDLLFPIFLNALKNDDIRLQAAAVEHFPLIARSLNPSTIRNVALPRISELLLSADHPDILRAVITSLGDCLDLVEHDVFTDIVLPKLAVAWRRTSSLQLAQSLPTLLQRLRPSLGPALREMVPLCSIVLASPEVDLEAQAQLVEISVAQLGRVAAERRAQPIERRAETDVLEVPAPRPRMTIIERPDAAEARKPKWSKTAPPDEESAFDLPSPALDEDGGADLDFVNDVLAAGSQPRPPLKLVTVSEVRPPRDPQPRVARMASGNPS